MKERPILFSAPMVRALLAGTKTQTRRIVKPQSAILSDEQARALGVRPPTTENSPVVKCPYGQPGDRLWVKETFFPAKNHRREPRFALCPAYIYRADYEYREPLKSVIVGQKWTPSIFCTRAASRIILGIVSVRVERLHAITEDDARAEGVEPLKEAGAAKLFETIWGLRHMPHASAYADLWNRINGPGSWDLNPWVWVIAFKRVGGAP